MSMLFNKYIIPNMADAYITIPVINLNTVTVGIFAKPPF